MQITVPREELQQALSVLQHITGAKTAIPLLANVRIAADTSGIELAASDLEVALRWRVQGDIAEGGTITLPGRKLNEIVSVLPDEPIQMESSGNQVQIVCDRVQYKLFGLPADEFPALPELQEEDEGLRIDGPILARMFQRTKFAAAVEEGRYFLNGVYFHLSPDWVRTVATDSRRLALSQLDLSGVVEKETGVIIPIKAVEETLRTFSDSEEVRIALREKQILFADDRAVLGARLLDGEYPAYSQLIPKSHPIQVEVEKELFATAIRRVSLLANPKTTTVRLEISSEEITLSASSAEFGEAREVVPASSNDSITIGFNARYLLDALGPIESKVAILELKEALTAAVIRDAESSEYLCLLMPVRLEAASL